jgi:hypothetical protein
MLFLPRTLLVAILSAALLTAGCGGIVKTFGDLMVVQNQLTKKFGGEVNVNTNDGGDYGEMFAVYFINSPLNDQSEEARQKQAAQAAQIVKATYSRIRNVRELWVGYLRKKTRFVVFHHNQIVSMHGFDNEAAPLPNVHEREIPNTNIQVTPTYDSDTDLTDISVNGIQLEGQPGGLGITLLPFFKVRGRVSEGKRTPPKIVSLNFASYAEKPRFAQTVPISFVADGKVIHKTEGSFTGRDAQFCYLIVPFDAFRRMVGAKELVIKLGAEEFPLTPSQIGAMHAMTEYVAE